MLDFFVGDPSHRRLQLKLAVKQKVARSTYPIDLIPFTWYTRNQASPFSLQIQRIRRCTPTIPACLVALRKAAGLSQAELAKLVRVSPKTIGFWETSPIPPRSDVLPLLARAL